MHKITCSWSSIRTVFAVAFAVWIIWFWGIFISNFYTITRHINKFTKYDIFQAPTCVYVSMYFIFKESFFNWPFSEFTKNFIKSDEHFSFRHCFNFFLLEIGFSHPLIRLVKSLSRHPYHILPHHHHHGNLCLDHTSILMEDIVHYCTQTQLTYILFELQIKRNKSLHLYMYVNNYSATTRTGVLVRRLSNHDLFLKTKDSQVFLQTDQ